jgi:hypothetical protein
MLPWQRTGFNPRLVNMRFVMDEVAIGEDFSEYLDFPMSISFHQRSILIFIYT